MRTKIVFMGSPQFAVPTLRALAENYPVVGVITQPDRPSGRGRHLTPPPVKICALEFGLPLIQPERIRQPDAMQQLRAWKPELIVVTAFGQILRTEVLDLPYFGCVNVHASLLPRWRGAAPIQAAILHGDEQTGITIMRMDTGVDTGPMINQRSLSITSDDTAASLGERLATAGADTLIDTLPGYLEGTLTPQDQNDSMATYAPMIQKEQGELDFSLPAVELERKVRAFNPWPGAFITDEGQSLKIHAARIESCDKHNTLGELGERIVYADYPAVYTGKDIFVLEVVQPSGKKSMSGKAFLQGARNWI